MTDRDMETSTAPMRTDQAEPESLIARVDAYPLAFLIFAGLMTGVSIGTLGYLLFS